MSEKHHIPPMAAGAKVVIGYTEWTLTKPGFGKGVWLAVSTDNRDGAFDQGTWSSGDSHTPAPSSVVERHLAEGWMTSDTGGNCRICLDCCNGKQGNARFLKIWDAGDGGNLHCAEHAEEAGVWLRQKRRAFSPERGHRVCPGERQAACDAIPFDARCSVRCYSARRHVEPEPVKAKPWRAPVSGGRDSLLRCFDNEAEAIAAVSYVARLPPMLLDTSRTMASRESRWKTDRDVTVGVDLDIVGRDA